MRGFFGVFGPDKDIETLINRYTSFRVSLNQTLFQDTQLPGLYLSQWLHDGDLQDDPVTQISEELVCVGWSSLYQTDILVQKLGLKGNYSSLELIQHAWLKWGSSFLDHIEGDFSFVLYDKRSGTLILAKDQVGIRPLFYARIGNCIIFGTTIPVLKSVFATPPEINRLYLAHDLKVNPVPVDLTLFKDIHRLKPAHYIELKSGDLPVETRYWDLSEIDLAGYSNEELTERVKQEIFRAVQCRIKDIQTVGCQLSGGLDSSVLAVILSKVMNKEHLHTFSFVLSEKTRKYSARGIDEQWSQDLVREFAGLLPENHHQITEFHYKDVFEEMDTSNRVMGGYANSDSIWQDTLFKKAAESGVRVSFSGFPGDEGVSNGGGTYYLEYIEKKQWKKLLEHVLIFHVRAIKHLYNYWTYQRTGKTKPGFAAVQSKRCLLRADVPEYDKIQDTSFDFHPSFKQSMKTKMLRAHTCLRTESEGTYANQYGIETRYPLADIRLLQLVYSLPTEMFRPKPYKRALFRNVCKGLLPEKVRLQPKFSGAMTLAFAEYWKTKTAEELEDYEITDPLNMYISTEDFNKKMDSSKTNALEKSRFTGLKKIDYFLKLNM